MMWNNNDTKYIIKRLILYFLITGIVFFAGQKCAKAETISTQHWSSSDDPSTAWLISQSTQYNVHGSPFKNANGNLVFTIYQAPTSVGVEILNEIIVSDNTNKFTCNLGTQGFYNDNSTQRYITSVVCPVSFNSNGWKTITLKKPGTGTLYLMTSEYADLTTTDDSAISSLSSQLTSIYNRMDGGFSDIYNMSNQQFNTANQHLYNIYQAINSSNSGVTTAINNQTTQITNEIDNNTQAINDLNDNIMADYNGPTSSDIDAINSLDGIFTNEDQDIIRGILLFPTRLFIILASALDSNSCVSYSFGYLLGTEIYLPCLNYKNIIGTNLYTIIDIVFGLCVLYGLVRYIIHLYDFIFSVGLKGGVVVSAVEVFK